MVCFLPYKDSFPAPASNAPIKCIQTICPATSGKLRMITPYISTWSERHAAYAAGLGKDQRLCGSYMLESKLPPPADKQKKLSIILHYRQKKSVFLCSLLFLFCLFQNFTLVIEFYIYFISYFFKNFSMCSQLCSLLFQQSLYMS